MTDSATPWDFIVALYRQVGMVDRCLDWQDRLGADVPLLLLLVWAGYRGRGLSDDAIRALIAHSDPWRVRVVLPLRGVRRRLKIIDGLVPATAAADLRRQVAALELEAERLAFDHLVPILDGLAQPIAGGDAGMRDHLARYLCALGADPAVEQDSINYCVMMAQHA